MSLPFQLCCRKDHSSDHLGLIGDGIERAFQPLESARASQDPSFTVYALEHLALSLSAAARCAEADRLFGEMREFGRRHGVMAMLARGISMSAVIPITLVDHRRAEEIGMEARGLARCIGSTPEDRRTSLTTTPSPLSAR